MIFSQDRSELRRMYRDAWDKRRRGENLSPLEAQIANVISEHPEYEQALSDEDRDYRPEDGQTNPFLHMGLHLGIREQVATDRPAGIRAIYQQLAEQTGDPHEAEHRMLDCLAEAIWQAQRNQSMPDEQAYLESLRHLTRQGDSR